jgi:hypothetical protein
MLDLKFSHFSDVSEKPTAPSSGTKSNPRQQPAKSRRRAGLAHDMPGSLFDPESTSLRNVTKILLDYTASHPRRQYSTYTYRWWFYE